MKHCIFVNQLHELKLRIIVVGYKYLGESILIILSKNHHNHEDVIYSILIDCYVYGKGNKKVDKIDEILRRYGIKELSVLIWTHPHEDHTIGLKQKISKYCRCKTKIISAPNFYNDSKDIIKLSSDTSKSLIDNLFSMSRFQRNALNRIGALPGSRNVIDEFFIEGFDTKIPVSLNIVAPIAPILDQYVHSGVTNKNPNEISLAIILCINNMSFFFGGDSPNNHLKEVDEYLYNSLKFVKIPHHASKTSDCILDFLNSTELEVACATQYSMGSSDLPDMNVLDRYKQIADYVLVTGDANHRSMSYGIAEFEYTLLHSDSPELNISTYGNAFIL